MLTLHSTVTGGDKGEDRISKLPNDIILTFLSPLGMLEAAKTSIVSKRWRYLWAMRTHLDFDHLLVLPESEPDASIIMYSLTSAQKSKYINWVNQVVDVHCGSCIDTFRVSFSLDSSDAHYIDKWVRFAFLKKVNNLELNLFTDDHRYTIGFDILKPLSGGGITFLKSLHLTCINVSGDILEYFLSQCRLLERLYVRRSKSLVSLKVVGLVLKQLTISGCDYIEELEIDAVHLIYFGYTGGTCKIVFKSVPVLVNVMFGLADFSEYAFEQISPVASQITNFYLNLECDEISAERFPSFSKLKQLNLAAGCQFEFDFFLLRQLLEACPELREFKLEISWKYDRGEANLLEELEESCGNVVENVFDIKEYLDIMEVERTTHPNLKVLQVDGFNGCNADVDLILFLVDSACNLETIACDPSRSLFDFSDYVDKEASRSRVGKLRKIIPHQINITII